MAEECGMQTASLLSAMGILCLAACAGGAGGVESERADTPGPPEDVACAADLGARAREVLARNCQRCHGQNGAASGGFDYVLDVARLVAEGLVLPGEPDASPLFVRAESGAMPPPAEQPRPSASDVALLASWIACGAADFGAEPARAWVEHHDVLGAIRDDLAALLGSDRRHARYLVLTHLYNAGMSRDDLDRVALAVAKLVNSLSRAPSIASPVIIEGAAGTILRIDLRAYRWATTPGAAGPAWSHLIDAFPYGIRRDDPLSDEIAARTEERQAYVAADWFVRTASRPPLYHTLAMIPESESLLAPALEAKDPMRAGFADSGVVQYHRVLERTTSPLGVYWKSFDFDGPAGAKNPFERPLGPAPARPFHFQNDGGEIIFSLPNGLHAYMVVDAAGSRIDAVPGAIAVDPQEGDAQVRPGRSCMSCHLRGILPFEDAIRPHVLAHPNEFEGVYEQVLLAYPPSALMEAAVAADRDAYAVALAQLGAEGDGPEPVGFASKSFEANVDLARAAAELGVRPGQLAAHVGQDLAAGGSVTPLAHGVVLREIFEAAFPSLVCALALGEPLVGGVAAPCSGTLR
jgi:mono/diheme cytochrome c family protein